MKEVLHEEVKLPANASKECSGTHEELRHRADRLEQAADKIMALRQARIEAATGATCNATVARTGNGFFYSLVRSRTWLAARGFRTATHFIAIAYLRMSKLKHLPSNPLQPAMTRGGVLTHRCL